MGKQKLFRVQAMNENGMIMANARMETKITGSHKVRYTWYA